MADYLSSDDVRDLAWGNGIAIDISVENGVRAVFVGEGNQMPDDGDWRFITRDVAQIAIVGGWKFEAWKYDDAGGWDLEAWKYVDPVYGQIDDRGKFQALTDEQMADQSLQTLEEYKRGKSNQEPLPSEPLEVGYRFKRKGRTAIITKATYGSNGWLYDFGMIKTSHELKEAGQNWKLEDLLSDQDDRDTEA